MKHRVGKVATSDAARPVDNRCAKEEKRGRSTWGSLEKIRFAFVGRCLQWDTSVITRTRIQQVSGTKIVSDNIAVAWGRGYGEETGDCRFPLFLSSHKENNLFVMENYFWKYELKIKTSELFLLSLHNISLNIAIKFYIFSIFSNSLSKI